MSWTILIHWNRKIRQLPGFPSFEAANAHALAWVKANPQYQPCAMTFLEVTP